MKKYIFLLFLIILLDTPTIFASTYTSLLEKKYSLISEKITSKYDTKNSIFHLKKLGDFFNRILLQTPTKDKSYESIRLLYDLNKKKIDELSLSIQEKGSFGEQKTLELKKYLELKSIQERGEKNETKVMLSGVKLFITNDNFEFIDNGVIKRFLFSKYIELSKEEISGLSSLKGLIIKVPSSEKYFYITDYTVEEKIPYSSLFQKEDLKKIFIEEEKKYILDGDNYYTFIFDTFINFADPYGFYNSSLKENNLSKDNIIFYRDRKGKFHFVSIYKKVKLIQKDILLGVTNKEQFLSLLVDDKRYIFDDSDEYFKQLKKTTDNLIGKITFQDKKVQKIYDWILENIHYTENLKLYDYKVYSGILTYKNKDGVCSGYSKLMGYMLLFAGISNIEIIQGYVIDVPDFPTIGHAWVKVGDDYYDPTFDDPIGAPDKRNFEDYKYFKLPKDIFYTNRYNETETLEFIKPLSLKERVEIVQKNLSLIADNYKKQDFLLLDAVKFKKKYSLSFHTPITIQALSSIIPVYSLSKDFSFYKDGKKVYISDIVYYTVKTENESIEDFLKSIRFGLKNLYLFKWEISKGIYEYRIATTISF